MEALEVPGHFTYEFICPQEIRGELEAGAVAGQPVVNPSWLHVCPLHWTLSRLALLAGLDAGEAAVILLALEQRIPLVCIDEWEPLVFIGINGLCGWP
jgi:predicted nucleic acid-binding protein